MEQILPVYSAPWAPPLPVTTIIPPKETAVEVLNEFLADAEYTESTWFTDGSLLEGSAGGAAVQIVREKVVARILIPLGAGQVAEGEIEGILRATEHALITGAEHILIVSDSQAGLKAVLSTAACAGQSRAILYDKLVHAAMVTLPSLRIINLWTPAHIGTVGNEHADDAAKAATRHPAPPSTRISLTTCKRQIDLLILDRWKRLWAVATTGRGLRAIDNSPPSLILRSPYDSFAARADITLLSRLRTDFSALNAHRFRSRLALSPACDACGAPQETCSHYLLHCPA
ncbi:hypothetical protein GGX14DRAFT_359844 [Mycena pura]|uniref:RNase H type-1 domain-containing protein n=1 Tax=Mycena pura TaxID=153505 RepID=A0AAD6VSH0_9AGAR|nr:hypothetical protein GGX14DRAFT_359844 [Mycena pura]